MHGQGTTAAAAAVKVLQSAAQRGPVMTQLVLCCVVNVLVAAVDMSCSTQGTMAQPSAYGGCHHDKLSSWPPETLQLQHIHLH